MSKWKVRIPILLLLLAVLGYVLLKYQQYSREWNDFETAWKMIEEDLVGEKAYEWRPNLFSTAGSMDLAGCNVTDERLAHLAGVVSLVSLNLAETQVTDAGMAHLKGLPRLRELDLTGTKVTNAAIEQLQQALPECKILH